MHKACFPVLMLATVAGASYAHDGRRFDIRVIDDQIVAQGYLSGANPTDDGGGVVRPYVNSIHGHFVNSPLPGSTNASADLPGFDLYDGGPFAGFGIDLTFVGASKWASPPISSETGMVVPGTVPSLTALGAGETIFVGYDGEFFDTTSGGSFGLLESITPSGELDIDLTYDIGLLPSNTIYVLDFVLSTDAPGVAPSDTVHVLLSPDGVGVVERLHFASLYLEEFLGTPVPSSGTVGLFGIATLASSRRRRG